MITSQEIAKSPHEVIMVNDDAVIIRLIAELGLANDFSQVPPPPKPGGREVSVIYGDHVTHWMCFTRFIDTGDDGYLLACLPKSKTAKDELGAALRRFGVGGDAIYFSAVLKDTTNDN